MTEETPDLSGQHTPEAGHQMSLNSFVFLTLVLTATGLVLAAFAGRLSYGTNPSTWPWPLLTGFIVGVVACFIIGTMMYVKSDKPAISATGYAFVAGSLGVGFGPLVTGHLDSLARSLIINLALVVILAIIGLVIPGWLSNPLGNLALVAMIGVLAGYFIVPIMALLGVQINGGMQLLDMIGVAIFCGFVSYDLYRIRYATRTLDKAIDNAATLFVDTVHVILRLPSMISDRR